MCKDELIKSILEFVSKNKMVSICCGACIIRIDEILYDEESHILHLYYHGDTHSCIDCCKIKNVSFYEDVPRIFLYC